MKFLIIGASGYLGGSCYNYLKLKRYPVVGTQHASRSSEFVRFNLIEDSIKIAVGDSFFTGEEKIFSVVFAAFSQVERCFREKKESYQVNVEGTIRLLKELVLLGTTPVYISTSAVYDGAVGGYDEESMRSPLTEYGKQKLQVENFIEENFPQAVILRIDKAVGDMPAERNPLSECYQLIKKKISVPCLEQRFSPTFVEDIAQSILLICEKNLQGSYHVANTEVFSREEFVQQLALVFGEECRVQRVSEKELHFQEKRPQKSFLNSTKFIKATQFSFTSMGEVFLRFKNNLSKPSIINEGGEIYG